MESLAWNNYCGFKESNNLGSLYKTGKTHIHTPLGDNEVLERFKCLSPRRVLANWAPREEIPASRANTVSFSEIMHFSLIYVPIFSTLGDRCPPPPLPRHENDFFEHFFLKGLRGGRVRLGGGIVCWIVVFLFLICWAPAFMSTFDIS